MLDKLQMGYKSVMTGLMNNNFFSIKPGCSRGWSPLRPVVVDVFLSHESGSGFPPLCLSAVLWIVRIAVHAAPQKTGTRKR